MISSVEISVRIREDKEVGRTIVVGDIHGCYDELSELLERAALRSDDRVVSVGDLIVKGEKNREVLDLFMSDKRFSAVLGNHDLKLLRYWKGETVSLKKAHQNALSELEVEWKRYADYLDSLPLIIDLGTHVVVHAGLRPGVSLEEQSVKDLTELRTLGPDRTSREGTPWYEVYDGEKVVLFGHWPAAAPRRAPRAIGLDTGCVYGYQLTALIIETHEFISVDARRAYDLLKPESG
jgi:diadenosine tetraphosphatase ApaH/serine/threonine PP2A family protein phosphatase